jgi:hypothetical protein
VIKSRRIRWDEHVARMGEMRNAHKGRIRNLTGSNQSEKLGVDGRIVLERILEKWVVKV